MGLPNQLPPAMDIKQHRRPSHARDALGRLPAEILGRQLPVARLHGSLELAQLRGCYCSGG